MPRHIARGTSRKVRSAESPALAEFWDIRKGLNLGDLRRYLAKGGDPNVRGVTKVTPLMIAARAGQLPAIKLLLDAGADVNVSDYQSTTPLHKAAEAGAADAVKLLLAHGANPKARDTYGEMPLYKVPNEGRTGADRRVRIVELLVAAGAPIEATGNSVTTVLGRAAEWGDLPVVRALLARSANPNPKVRPLDLAVEYRYKEVERALIAAGAKPSGRPTRSEEMPRYEFVKGTSSKFWEIGKKGNSVTTTYGRIGAKGQSTIKKFASPKEADVAYVTLINEKIRKGYKLVAGDSGTDDEPEDDGKEWAAVLKLLEKHTKRLRQARGNDKKVRVAIAAYLKEGDELLRSPYELRDYFDISSPGMVGKAGFNKQERERAAKIFEHEGRRLFGN